MNEQALDGKLAVAGAIEYRDKDGNLIKTVPFNGSVPLTKEDDDGDSSECS